MSILEELYNGNINPVERFVKKESEYQRISRDISKRQDSLYKTLTQEEREIYEDIFENNYKLEYISEKEGFIQGFRLGAKIMLEILTEPKSCSFEYNIDKVIN